jgi:hypothetical protein
MDDRTPVIPFFNGQFELIGKTRPTETGLTIKLVGCHSGLHGGEVFRTHLQKFNLGIERFIQGGRDLKTPKTRRKRERCEE